MSGCSVTSIESEIARLKANPEEDVREFLKLDVTQHFEPEFRPRDGPTGLLDDRAPFLGYLCQSGSPVVWVACSAHETLRLQSIDRVGDARWMDLQPGAHLAERQPGERQQHQCLKTRKSQAKGGQGALDARHHDALNANQRRGGGHPIGFGPALLPLVLRFRNRIEGEGIDGFGGHLQV